MGDDENTSSALPPDKVNKPALTESLRWFLPAHVVKASRLVLDQTGVNDSRQSSFIERHLGPEDSNTLVALHAEWFPLSYREDFFEKACNGKLYSVALCCKTSNSQHPALLNADGSYFGNLIGKFIPRIRPRPCPAPLVGVCVISSAEGTTVEDCFRILVYLVEQKIFELSSMRVADKDEFNNQVLAYLNERKFDLGQLYHVMAYIMTLGVLQEFRGKGLAKYLVEAAKRRIIETNQKVLYLHVVEYNTVAMEMYKSCGFIFCEKCPQFYNIYDEMYASYLAIWISPYRNQFLETLVDDITTHIITVDAGR